MSAGTVDVTVMIATAIVAAIQSGAFKFRGRHRRIFIVSPSSASVYSIVIVWRW
jgi:hypothetical protein